MEAIKKATDKNSNSSLELDATSQAPNLANGTQVGMRSSCSCAGALG